MQIGKALQIKPLNGNAETNTQRDGSPFNLCSRRVTYPGETVEQRIIDVPTGTAVDITKQVGNHLKKNRK